MPVYNGERYIRQALDSLVAQHYEHFELIISDNASTDQTVEICQEYLTRDKRIRYYRNSENYGSVANFNRVLELAKGDYFMWAGYDDLWEPTYVELLKTLLDKKGDAVVAFSAFNSINEHGEEVKPYRLLELPSDDPCQRLLNYIMQEEYLGKANLIYGLMRRSAIEAAGGFKVWGKGLWGADMLVVFRLLSFGDLVLTNDVLFRKRLRSSLPNSFHTHGSTSLSARIAEARSTIRGWHDYFSSYASIVDVIDYLTTSEKARLKRAIRKRSLPLYFREVSRYLFAPVFAWIIGGVKSRISKV